MKYADDAFRKHLSEAVRFHGHLCGGQVLGVRMAMAGMREMGITDRGGDWKHLVILVEIDRCPADAIISVTGRSPGKRSLRIIDYGKHAATFVNTRTGEAVRVSQSPESHAVLKSMTEELTPDRGEKVAYIDALCAIPEERLLSLQRVRVHLPPEDLPGESQRSVICSRCGELVRDRRDLEADGHILCRPCAAGSAYYEPFEVVKVQEAQPAPVCARLSE